MSGNSAKVRKRFGEMPNVREKSWERSGSLCSWGNLIVSAQQNNFIRTVIHFSYMMFMENLD